MAAAACKIIINSGLHAFAQGLETVLRSREARDVIGIDGCDKLLERMIAVDLAAMNGGTCEGYKAIADELITVGVLDARIYF